VNSPSYYVPAGRGRYRPTRHVQGAWNDGEQHMGPVAGLLTDCIERHEPRPELQLSRVSFDILGLIPLQESTIEVRTLRPGRTIELIEATMQVAGRTVVRAAAWRLLGQDTHAVAGGGPAPLPAPDDVPDWSGTAHWDGGYIASLQIKKVDDAQPGRGQVWLRSDVDLVAGEPVSATAHYLRLVDTANGIAVRADPRRWSFPNVDLTVHLFRQPTGPWVGLDTTVVIGDEGLGVTSSWLFDEHGAVGRAEQSLTVRPTRR
jgi:Thioesterase-like superfamily